MIQTNLKDLIKEVVNSLIVDDTTFSIYDITGIIRKTLTNGNIEIPELRVQGQSYEFEVQHKVVKSLFTDMFLNDEFHESLTSTFTGKYFEYKVCKVGLQPLKSNSSTVPNIIVQPIPPKFKQGLNVQIVEDRVATYLKNWKKNHSGMPTVKQVQSAIKRGNEYVGWTCKDLVPLIAVICSKV